ncbi:hypothetical protein IAR50_007546 [Cryptococcus sp. DSM 104548]
MAESSSNNNNKDYPYSAISSQFAKHYQHLSNINYLRDELNHTISVLDKLSRKGLLDPSRDYKDLTNMSAMTLVSAAGGEVSKNPDAVLHNGHREWNAADASRWAQLLYRDVENLAEQGESYYGLDGLMSAGEGDVNEQMTALLGYISETVQDGTASDEDDLREFAQMRHLGDGIRSHIIAAEVLPSMANKIYNDLSASHPVKTDVAPSTRKNKNAIKWDRSLSDIKGAIATFRASSSRRWPGKSETVEELETCIDKAHTVLVEDQEKTVKRKLYEDLFDGPKGVISGVYETTRIGDLVELLTSRKEHLEGSLKELKDDWTAATGQPDYPQETALPVTNFSPEEISDFGMPTEMLLIPLAYDRLSKQLNEVVDTYEYDPETNVFRPSIAQSYLRSFVGLQDQVHHRFDKYLRENTQGVDVPEKATRAQLLEASHAHRHSMLRSTATRKEGRRLTREFDQASKIEAKYDTMIESLVGSLYAKVETARDNFERINEEQDTRESRVNAYRSNADFHAATALVKEHYPNLVHSTNRSGKSHQQDIQLDIVAAKEYLDMAWKEWKASEADETPVETLLDELSLAPAKEGRDMSLEGSETATARKWKPTANFSWADDDDDDGWWKEQMKYLGGDTERSGEEDKTSSAGPATSPQRSRGNVWFSSTVPSSKRLFG